MARLVLTQALPRGRSLAERLERDGHRVALLAFTELKPLDGGFAALRRARLESLAAVVCVSPSAAQFAARARPGPWPSGGRLLAIGPGTAETLVAVGLAASLAGVGVAPGPRHDADALLDLPELAGGAGRRLLVLAGDGGRSDWLDVLRERGFDVEVCRLYERTAHEPDDPDWALVDAWAAAGDTAAFVVTGSATAKRLDRALRDRGLAGWAHEQPGFGPHENIVRALAGLGWRKLRDVETGERLLQAAIESV